MFTPADSLAVDSLQSNLSKELIQPKETRESEQSPLSTFPFLSADTAASDASPLNLLHADVLESVEIPAYDGYTGSPRPYTFRSDDVVTTLLLLSLFFLSYVVTTSRHYLAERVKVFFRPVPEESDRAEHTGSEMRGRFFVLLTLSFCSAILYYDYLTDSGFSTLLPESPYIPLGCVTLAVLLFLLSKLALYRFVNGIFFSANKREQWVDDFHLVVLFLAVTVLCLTLLVVFFDLTFSVQRTAFLINLLITASLLLYRCFRTFCSQVFDALHIFLYFCTLEIIPALVVWRLLFLGSTCLVDIL